MFFGPNHIYVRVIQKLSHWSRLTLAFQRTGEFAERQRAGDIEEQRLLAIDRLTRGARRCPVSPFAWDCKRAPLGMAQAQRLYA